MPDLDAVVGTLVSPDQTGLIAFQKSCTGFGRFTALVDARGTVDGRLVSSRFRLATMLGGLLRLESLERATPRAFLAALSIDDTAIYLPHANQVVRGAPPDLVIAAVLGVPLSSQELWGALTACPLGGGAYGGTWSLAPGVQRFLLDRDEFIMRQDSNASWRLWSYTHPMSRPGARWRAVFDRRSHDRLPFSIHLTSLEVDAPRGQRFDVTWTLSAVEVEPALASTAFAIDIPPSASPTPTETVMAGGPLVLRSRRP